MKKIFRLSAILALPLLSACEKTNRNITVEITGILENKATYANGCALYINSGNVTMEVKSFLEKDCATDLGATVTMKLPMFYQ